MISIHVAVVRPGLEVMEFPITLFHWLPTSPISLTLFPNCMPGLLVGNQRNRRPVRGGAYFGMVGQSAASEEQYVAVDHFHRV